jgi:hypothetical protein
MGATTPVLCGRLKWYRVVLSDGSPIGPDLQARVQAKKPDAALQEMMRMQRIGFAASASIWLLGRSGAPTLRSDVRCRLPRVQLCRAVRVGR